MNQMTRARCGLGSGYIPPPPLVSCRPSSCSAASLPTPASSAGSSGPPQTETAAPSADARSSAGSSPSPRAASALSPAPAPVLWPVQRCRAQILLSVFVLALWEIYSHLIIYTFIWRCVIRCKAQKRLKVTPAFTLRPQVCESVALCCIQAEASLFNNRAKN